MITRPAPRGVHRYARLLLIVYLTGSVDFASSFVACPGVNWCSGWACPTPEHRSGETAAATVRRCKRQAAHQVPPSYRTP